MSYLLAMDAHAVVVEYADDELVRCEAAVVQIEKTDEPGRIVITLDTNSERMLRIELRASRLAEVELLDEVA